jgi:hypothetical protein
MSLSQILGTGRIEITVLPRRGANRTNRTAGAGQGQTERVQLVIRMGDGLRRTKRGTETENISVDKTVNGTGDRTCGTRSGE